MTPLLPPLRLTGALCLREGHLQQRSVALADGRFTTGPLPAVDLTGYLLLPGIVDLCAALPAGPARDGDAIHLADLEAARHGVTTRCLAVPWSWEGPAASPETARATVAAIRRLRGRTTTDLRAAVTAEALLTDAAEALVALARAGGVDMVLFSNRGEAAREAMANDADAATRLARAAGMPAAAWTAALDAVLPNAKAVPRALCRLAEVFDDLGVVYGSTADASAETREHHSMIGARLCLNPGTVRAAAAARAVGDPVLADAGGLLCEGPGPGRPFPSGPLPGGAAAETPQLAALVRAGLCDGLVSGGHSAAPLIAAFRLADLGVLSFERTWRLVSEVPAQILRLPDRGVIAPGKRADLVVVHAATRRVEATIAGGRLGFLAGEAARRFPGSAMPAGRLAAE